MKKTTTYTENYKLITYEDAYAGVSGYEFIFNDSLTNDEKNQLFINFVKDLCELCGYGNTCGAETNKISDDVTEYLIDFRHHFRQRFYVNIPIGYLNRHGNYFGC